MSFDVKSNSKDTCSQKDTSFDVKRSDIRIHVKRSDIKI
jgi:hypothetical protein